MASILRLGKLWRIKRELIALLVALGDPRTPMAGRIATIGSLLYLISPFDIVPDLIPLAGLLDDLILVPMGLTYAHRQVPEAVLADARARSERYNTIANWSLLAITLFVLSIVALGIWGVSRLFGQ